jgi:DNA-binding protein HU-beta
MAKQDILNTINGKVKSNKEAVAAVFDAIFDVLSTVERCRIPGFGTFERRVRSARKGLKPGTQIEISIPEKKTLAFRISTDFRDALNPEPVAPVVVEAPKKSKAKGTTTATTTAAAPKKTTKTVEAKVEAPVEAPKTAKKAAPKAAEAKVEAKVEAPKAAAKTTKKK